MTGCWILDARYCILDTGYPESRNQFPASSNDYQKSNELSVRRVRHIVWGKLDNLILDAGFWILDGGNLIPDAGYLLLDAGYSILDAGY